MFEADFARATEVFELYKADDVAIGVVQDDVFQDKFSHASKIIHGAPNIAGFFVGVWQSLTNWSTVTFSGLEVGSMPHCFKISASIEFFIIFLITIALEWNYWSTYVRQWLVRAFIKFSNIKYDFHFMLLSAFLLLYFFTTYLWEWDFLLY